MDTASIAVLPTAEPDRQTAAESGPNTVPATDVTEMTFFEMTAYQKMTRIGSALLYAVDSIGEYVASTLGITSSKFQYVIDAQNRQKYFAELERKREAEELEREHEAMRAAGIDPATGQHTIELAPAQTVPITRPAPVPEAPVQSSLPANINAFAHAGETANADGM